MQGAWFFTVGQRGGIGLPGGPWYVVSKDPRMNVVRVSRRYHEPAAAAARRAFACGQPSWIAGAPPEARELQLRVKVRPNCRFVAASCRGAARVCLLAAKLGSGKPPGARDCSYV
jgi:tRNA U34 2-thiouridine synthase MnmA/TrmU